MDLNLNSFLECKKDFDDLSLKHKEEKSKLISKYKKLPDLHKTIENYFLKQHKNFKASFHKQIIVHILEIDENGILSNICYKLISPVDGMVYGQGILCYDFFITKRKFNNFIKLNK